MTRRVLRGLAVVALVGQIVWHVWDLSPAGLLDRSGRLKAPDFLQFYTFGRLVVSNKTATMYDDDAHVAIAREIHPRLTLSNFKPNYSPAIALLMAPLAGLSYGAAMAAFSAVSLILYALAIRIVFVVTQYLRRLPLEAAIACAAWPTLFMVLRYGQISALTLTLVALGVLLHARGSPWWSGAAFGLIAYKPNLLMTPALALFVAGEWRLVAGLVTGAVAVLALGTGVAGIEAMTSHLTILFELAGEPSLVQLFPTEQHSLRGLLQLSGVPPVLLKTATWTAIPLTALAAARIWRRASDVRVRWAVLVVAALLGSPHLLTYDLLLLAVPLVLLSDWLFEQPEAERRSGWRLALWLLYLGAWPGTLFARIYSVQVSTIGMLLAIGLALRTWERSQVLPKGNSVTAQLTTSAPGLSQ